MMTEPKQNNTEYITDLTYLNPNEVELTTAGAELRLTLTGQFCVPQLMVSRIFPLSNPDRYISLCDGGGAEVGIVCDPRELDRSSQKALQEALNHRYVVPVIRRITRMAERFGTLEWDVETDRGQRQFTTRELRDNMRNPEAKRYLITDIDSITYDIPDVEALDHGSRALLLQHL